MQYTREQRDRWHGMFVAIAQERGYAPGWVAHKYREKFGVFPAWGIKPEPIEPSPEFRSWVRSRTNRLREGQGAGGMSRDYMRRNRIAEQFAPRTIRMLESPAYRALSLPAHRVLSRIEIELAHHGGRDNGKLPVTFDHFVEYGVRRHSVASAIRELEALGFIEVTEQGRAGNAEWRRPNKFRLTNSYVGRAQPTNEWARIKTDEDAKTIARAARARQAPPRSPPNQAILKNISQ